MDVNIKTTSGPALERPGDMAAVLNSLNEGDILFIDEIHRLNRMIEEILYPAMEDFVIDIMIGKGPGARSVRLDLPRFTLIGATTRIGLLTAPLRDRFGVVQRLEPYSVENLKIILKPLRCGFAGGDGGRRCRGDCAPVPVGHRDWRTVCSSVCVTLRRCAMMG